MPPPASIISVSQFQPKRCPVVDLLEDLGRNLHRQPRHRGGRVVRLKQEGEQDTEAPLDVCMTGHSSATRRYDPEKQRIQQV